MPSLNSAIFVFQKINIIQNNMGCKNLVFISYSSILLSWNLDYLKFARIYVDNSEHEKVEKKNNNKEPYNDAGGIH